MEKSFKNSPRLYLYHQILTQHPKIVNIKPKNDFECLSQWIIKKSTKDDTLRRMNEIKSSFDGKFEGNILIVGRTRCGKTTFVQNLGKNKLFGNITTVYWISKISLWRKRRKNKRKFQRST